MRTQNIETIRAACVKANPDIRQTKANLTRFYTEDRPIRLADLLFAMRQQSVKALLPFEDFTKRIMVLVCGDGTPSKLGWNLRADDLTQHTDERLEVFVGFIINEL